MKLSTVNTEIAKEKHSLNENLSMAGA